jgi:hypothetical protein
LEDLKTQYIGKRRRNPKEVGYKKELERRKKRKRCHN